jgi:hypothetical protein
VEKKKMGDNWGKMSAEEKREWARGVEEKVRKER